MQQRSFVLSVSLPPWLRILEQQMLEISFLEFISKMREFLWIPWMRRLGA